MNFMKLRRLEIRKMTFALSTDGLFFKGCFLHRNLVAS